MAYHGMSNIEYMYYTFIMSNINRVRVSEQYQLVHVSEQYQLSTCIIAFPNLAQLKMKKL